MSNQLLKGKKGIIFGALDERSIAWRTALRCYEEGAQIVSELDQTPVQMLGHVTSSYFSPNLGKSIALAVVKGGKNMMGKKLFIPMEDKTINVTVVDPVFLDKENNRLNA